MESNGLPRSANSRATDMYAIAPGDDEEVDELAEEEEYDEQKRLKSKWAALEKVVGAEIRDENIAKDLIDEIELDFSQDLDTPRALQKLRVIEKSQTISDGVKYQVFKAVDPLFGLDFLKPVSKDELPADLAELLKKRQLARSSGDFNESDRLRDLLEKNGIAVKDSKEGQSWDWQL